LFGLSNHFKQLGDQGNLASHVSFFHALQLSFSHSIHDLVALQRSPRRLKGEETHPRFRQAFDEAVILFHEIIQILHLPQFNRCRKDPSGFEVCNGFGVGSILVQRPTLEESVWLY
jgi:hypothetical protein